MNGARRSQDRKRGRNARALRRCYFRLSVWLLLISVAVLRAGSAPAPRVVVVVEGGASIYLQAARGFAQGFGTGGDIAYIQGDAAQLDARISALRAQPPRLVVGIGTQAAKAARAALPGVPVLYCLALNPVQNHLVGPDIGGITLDVAVPQQFADIQKVLPRVQRIGVVYDEATSGAVVRQAQQFLKGKVRLVARDARTPQEASRRIAELMGQIDAFWLVWDPVIANPANFRLLVESSMRNKVALIAPASPFVEAGALLSVGPDYIKAGQQLGAIARQVLEGKRAGEFQAEPPSVTMLTINAPVARQLGIPIPPDLHAEILAPSGAQ